MSKSEEYRAWRKEYDANLLRQGRDEGHHDMLARQFARKLGRPLTEAERGTLRARLGALGDAVGDVVIDLDPAALEAWLATPAAH
ncbi:MAG: hypothetical protein U0324_23280 [Polyangiales bacterium]